MATKIKMEFPDDDDDDLDVEALRLAALQSLKKPALPPNQNQSSSLNVPHMAGALRPKVQGGPHQQPTRGRGRGRGRGRARGGFQNYNNQNFFTNRPAGNSNLITIVPTVPDEPCQPKETKHKGSLHSASLSGSAPVHSTDNQEEKVPAKFSRLDDDSESDESDDDTHVKVKSEAESSGEEDDEKEKDENSGGSDPESDDEGDLVTIKHEEDDEGDNSLERLMRELEEEISDTPKDKKMVSSTDKSKLVKVPRVKKNKKDKLKKMDVKCDDVDDQSNLNSTDQPDGPTHTNCGRQSDVHLQGKASRSPNYQETLRHQSTSPQTMQAARISPSRCKAVSPACITAPQKSLASQRLQSPARSPPRSRSPLRSRSPRRSRTPVLSRSPRRSRTPLKSRSPRRSSTPLKARSPQRSRTPLKSRLRSPRRSRSPFVSRSPPRSPLRSHYPASARSPNYIGRTSSRSPYRSPRRSPHYSTRAVSPGRLPPLRARSRSPRPRSRSPGRVIYARRSRSRTPLGSLRRSPSPSRRISPYRRSRSRSPGGRLYTSRRSRSLSPRVPLGPRRSPSPRSRRSPLYVKKLSPKRRSISPKRRSISPRRRSMSPRRRPLSPGWSRQSPPRSRSPVGSFNQRPLSPRRRSPYGDSYHTRRSLSPASRKHSPVGHRGGSPGRNYRPTSPMPRPVVRRRSPVPMSGQRRSPAHYRAASPPYRPPSPKRAPSSPGRNRVKQRPLSPLPTSSRNSQRQPSPRRQRSPAPHTRGHHTKALSPARKISPTVHSRKRSVSPSRETVAPVLDRGASPNDSISLSPTPERQLATKTDDRNRGRKSHPLGENPNDSKRIRSDLRNALPRRKETSKDVDINPPTHDELTKREKKEKKRAKRERERQKKEAHQGSSHVLEARRRKFESSQPVDVSAKKIRLRNMDSEPAEAEEQEESKDMEINVEKEKERELKEVNDVDESILDRELMGGVDLLWSDEEEEEEEEEEDVAAPVPDSNSVEFKRTFNVSSSGSGKENIPDDCHDSKKDEDEEPTSTTSSPVAHLRRDGGSDLEDCEAASDSSGEIGDQNDERETEETWPKTNRELKAYILSQAKSSGAVVRFPKAAVKELPNKIKSNDSDVDLRAELSRRRAERLTKVNICPESLPGRLLQSALQGAGVKSRRDKSHRRRGRSPPSFEDNLDKQESEGRRVLVLRRAAEQREPAINITISEVESSKETSTLKISGKLPIHMRLGTGKKGDDSPKKVKLKRNITVGRKKQV